MYEDHHHRQGDTYLIRGPWTVRELRSQYEAFVRRFGARHDFDQWLGSQGKVYLKLEGKK